MIAYFVYAGLAAVSAIFIVYMVKSFAKKDRIGIMIGRSIAMGLVLLLSYSVNYIHDNTDVMILCCCIEHVAMAWMLFFASLFILEFCERSVPKGAVTASCGVLFVDSIVLVTNPFNHFASDFFIKVGKYNSICRIVPKVPYYVHVGLCFVIFLLILFELGRKFAVSSRYYRTKYRTIMIVVLISFVFNIMFWAFDSIVFDFTRVTYAAAVIVIYNVTYHFIPQKLLRKLQRIVSDSIFDATVIYNNKGKLLNANERAKDILSLENFEDCGILKERLQVTGEEDTVVYEKDGEIYEAHYRLLRDRKGIFVASTFIFHDVTEARNRLEREHRAATFDHLTQCYNREGFFEASKNFFDDIDKNHTFVVMVSGICNFKGINSLYGTKIGDRALKEITGILHDAHHRFPMLYARTSEGKFTTVLPLECVDEITNELSSFPLNIEEGVTIHVEMNHGFVMIREIQKGIGYYYEQALLALAMCKKRATLPILEYTLEMDEEQHRKQALLSEAHDALEKKEFFIELQPQINLSTRKVCGAEALVRWNHPKLGRVSPMEFIPLFESNGFISKVDKYVWEETARTLKDLIDKGLYNGPMSVNVSRIDMMCFDVVEVFTDIIEKTGIPIDRLHIEITESASVDNKGMLSDTMKELKRRGFVVEIDDFGSGYSSLNALMTLPFDVVKLDMDFMKNSVKDEKSSIILRSIANMIHDLGAKIICEGVETHDNLESAGFFESDIVQGHYISQPIPIETFLQFVKENS